MSSTVEVNCQWCKSPFTARVADRKRGWGRFCSKSCKASKQEKRTGQNKAFRAGTGISHSALSEYQRRAKEWDDEVDAEGWDAHKDWL